MNQISRRWMILLVVTILATFFTLNYVNEELGFAFICALLIYPIYHLGRLIQCVVKVYRRSRNLPHAVVRVDEKEFSFRYQTLRSDDGIAYSWSDIGSPSNLSFWVDRISSDEFVSEEEDRGEGDQVLPVSLTFDGMELEFEGLKSPPLLSDSGRKKTVVYHAEFSQILGEDLLVGHLIAAFSERVTSPEPAVHHDLDV